MWDWRESCQLAHVANPAGAVFGFATNEFKAGYKQRQGQRSAHAPRKETGVLLPKKDRQHRLLRAQH